MDNQSSQLNKSFKDALLKKIESEQVCPRSKFSFLCQECGVWFFWMISVVVGAFAVAVSLFVVTHRQYELYEATHNNFFTFVVEVLPYVWIITFILMVFIAVYNFRNTKHGYRYSLRLVVISSVILSFAGGSSLQMFGLGYTIDNILGQQMPIYQSQGKLEQKMWQMPNDGRLLGVLMIPVVSTTSIIVFHDVEGREWSMNIDELNPRDIDLLSSGKTVRLLGECTDKENGIFHACAVFPWMIESMVTVQDMKKERKAFVDRSVNKQDICVEIMNARKITGESF